MLSSTLPARDRVAAPVSDCACCAIIFNWRTATGATVAGRVVVRARRCRSKGLSAPAQLCVDGERKLLTDSR